MKLIMLKRKRKGGIIYVPCILIVFTQFFCETMYSNIKIGFLNQIKHENYNTSS